VRKSRWRLIPPVVALAAAVTLPLGCSSGDNVPLMKADHFIDLAPAGKTGAPAKDQKHQKGQSSGRMKRDPSRPAQRVN
jgi:hypothetical protein